MTTAFGDGEVFIRLLVAGGSGMVLGLPYRKRPGGVRTHYLVTLGAALFCTAGANLTDTPADTLRIVQGVASGIGFVGAASVLKKGSAIFGITTAASIWTAAAVGCEAALGDMLRAACLAAAIALTSWLVGKLEHRVFHRRRVMARREHPPPRAPPGRAQRR
ncbi:MgtC/SapB family protein [Corallococcus exiguus]|uniref:MgtC/SapB family protein n=1 Tax=Corallococcus TaxID=83461 RepID=UPI000ECA7A93|nr:MULTISPECIES: MgtC/SapB family protein [Corallococcus]NNB90821.1 MgtC/SapB family protein [Corallococcus exiguus]NNB98596.1 MgtC/SapB family protein [Corallococcus exiguus]NNC07401.1 MgtC/SapB family protein [Corallococcus exiguus]NPC50321.1 MgtC/SapB family protein [Corallococcus exiguus]RKH78512.1 MgtC/SapB family protein [Corallococcus sp. AB032C]